MVKEFGYEYDAELDKELWQQSQNKVTYETLWGAICLRSGRDALKVIAREYAPTIVLMPALACDSMLLPFEMYGHRIVFYRLKEDYTIDLNNLKDCLAQNALFLYMDYFGIPAIEDGELYNLKKDYPGLVFIEDRTHNLIHEKKRAFTADYTIASLRKWIQIPDGGLLWLQKPLANTSFGEDSTFSTTRLKAQCMRNEYFRTGNEEIKTEYRKIFSKVSDILDNDIEPSRMSLYAYQLAKKADWEEIRSRRKENAQRLMAILKKTDVRFIQQVPGISDLYVAFIISDRTEIQAKLSRKGIFNTIIWPLSERQKEMCAVAKNTAETMLAAPCDQRYSIDDMDYIGNEMIRVFNE